MTIQTSTSEAGDSGGVTERKVDVSGGKPAPLGVPRRDLNRLIMKYGLEGERGEGEVASR